MVLMEVVRALYLLCLLCLDSIDRRRMCDDMSGGGGEGTSCGIGWWFVVGIDPSTATAVPRKRPHETKQ